MSKTLIGSALLWASVACAWAEPRDRPNFVVILADDLGYGDVGFHKDQPIRTPQLDRLAEEGMELTSFYAAPVCTPARAALLTGRYPIRSGLARVLAPGSRRGIPDSELTLAEMLKSQGYATACVGKWHLGDRPEFRPGRHGFDRYFGLLYSNDMTLLRLKPRRLKLYRGADPIETPVKQSTLTRRYTEESIRFLETNRDRPFLLYLAHSMPHFPQHASASFRGQSPRGIYGDAVEEIDWSTGQIVQTLKALDLESSTLVVFTSDNGPAVGKKLHGGSVGPLRGGKNTTWEGGVRVPFIARWPGRISAGLRSPVMASLMDLLPTLARLSGASLPEDRPIDGKDIMPVLAGSSAVSPHQELYFFRGDEIFAVRSGRWKLHFKQAETGPQGLQDARLCVPPKLYDLESDISESTPVEEAYPEIAERLRKLAADFSNLLPGVRLPESSRDSKK